VTCPPWQTEFQSSFFIAALLLLAAPALQCRDWVHGRQLWLLFVCRCMAISAAIFVGGIEPWKDALLARAQALKVGAGAASDTDVGPLISPQARDRAAKLIQSGIDQVCRADISVAGRMMLDCSIIILHMLPVPGSLNDVALIHAAAKFTSDMQLCSHFQANCDEIDCVDCAGSPSAIGWTRCVCSWLRERKLLGAYYLV
jgi:hypothetical protein